MKICSVEDIYGAEMNVSEVARYLDADKKVVNQLMEFGEIKAVRDRGSKRK